ncbi:MAG: alpha/beta fold hydrolase [Pirellulales bacterium]|jgi:pimeloyl-ACP methyl ester carboxylesterase
MEVLCNDCSFHVELQGEGSPLLLVHGFPLDHTMWTAQIEFFAQTHLVIAPDLRGFGKSADSNEIVSMQQFADDLAAILDTLSIHQPITFCGLSMGGYIGLQFVKHYQERLERLILLDTRSAADDETTARARRQMANTVLTEGLDAVPRAMIPKLLSEATRQDLPEVEQTLTEMILRQFPSAVAAAQRGMAERPSSDDLLAQINIPTLVLCGQHDRITPVAEMQSMAERIPNAKFVVIENAGHMSPMENPDAVNQQMAAFLQPVAVE